MPLLTLLIQLLAVSIVMQVYRQELRRQLSRTRILQGTFGHVLPASAAIGPVPLVAGGDTDWLLRYVTFTRLFRCLLLTTLVSMFLLFHMLAFHLPPRGADLIQ